jgi:tRNA(Ile)-lysidine synthase TilS/MesJ
MEIPYTVILAKRVLMAENRSRNWRKKNFFRFLQFHQISKLVTGHTKSDTFEKNLTNLFRGTSPKSVSQNVGFDSKKTIIMFFSCFIFKPLRSPYWYFSNKNKFSYIFFLTDFKNPKQKRIVKNFTNGNLAKPKPNKQKVDFLFFRKSSILKKYVSKHNQFHRETPCIFEKNASPKYVGPLRPSVKKRGTKTKSIFCFLNKEIFFSLSTFQRVDFLDFSHEFQITNSYSNNFVFFYRDPLSWSFCFSNKKFKDKKTFIKPLEKINRSSISKIVNLYDFPIISDFTNFDTSFSRNKIRHHILPFMKIFGQKKVESLMTKFFYLVNQDNQKLTYEICEFNLFLEFLRDQKSNLKIDFSIILISKLHISIKQLLLQNLVLKYREIELNFRHIVFLENYINTKY